MTWQVTGASEPGTSHLKDGRHCDDAHASWWDEGAGVLVLAVADGAGSAAHGAEAARIAVDVVVEACQHRLPQLKRGKVDTPARWEAFMHYVVHAVRYQLEQRAARVPSEAVKGARHKAGDAGSHPQGAPHGLEHEPSRLTGAPVASQHDEALDANEPGAMAQSAQDHDAASTQRGLAPAAPDRSAAPETVAQALELLELETFALEAKDASGNPTPGTEGPTDDVSDASDLVGPSIGAASPPSESAARGVQADAPASLRDFATTLLAAVVTECWLACIQIGDGVIVVRRDGALEALTHPAKGEYANQTDFVTADVYTETTQSRILRNHGVDAIALMSDGLERLAIELATNTPHAAFFRNLFAFAGSRELGHDERHAALSQELRSEKVNRLTDDDKTLLVAVRAKASRPHPPCL